MAFVISTYHFGWLSILVLLGRKRKNGAIYFNHTLRIKWRDHRRNQSNYLIKEFFNMEKSRYLRIYDLHSWSGIVLGLLVFIVSFTGCLALFDHELKSWEDPAKRLSIAQEPAEIMPSLEAWVDKNTQGGKVQRVIFRYPDLYRPFFRAFMSVKHEGEDKTQTTHEILWDTHTAEPLLVKEPALSEWILDFHRDLMWPSTLGGRTVGRSLVGVVGIILMLSIITGIITHTKIIREFFTLRVNRSIHLKWQDMHKVIGLWSLPFSTMIAFTGAFLGLIAILAPLAAVLAFKGDTDALLRAVNDESSDASGIQAQMYSVDEVANYNFPNTDRLPSQLTISHWGDKNAEYRVAYESVKELSRVDTVILNGATGSHIKTTPSSKVSPANRASNTITPLHYATYGGISLKVLYFVLGIFLCIVTATGLMVWVERRLKTKKGKQNPEYYHKLGRLIIGTTLGFPIASISIFYLDKLYVGSEASRLFYTGITYFSAVAMVIIFAMLRKNDYSTVRILFMFTAISCLLLPLINAIKAKSNFIAGLSDMQPWAWVDVSFICVSVILFISYYCLPKQRAEEPRQNAQILQKNEQILNR